MTRTRIKICGITNKKDAANAVACGVDALGFNFYEKSPRYIPPATAAEIVTGLPPFVTTVGLFVNKPAAGIESILELLHLDLLQFHGDEKPEACAVFNHPYIKALRATSREEIVLSVSAFGSACGILLDTSVEGQFGGTGKTFDWNRVPELSKPVILAGGLDETNVGEAVTRLRPYSVDVSGGVERSKGIKDMEKMKAFVEAVQSADSRIREMEQ